MPFEIPFWSLISLSLSSSDTIIRVLITLKSGGRGGGSNFPKFVGAKIRIWTKSIDVDCFLASSAPQAIFFGEQLGDFFEPTIHRTKTVQKMHCLMSTRRRWQMEMPPSNQFSTSRLGNVAHSDTKFQRVWKAATVIQREIEIHANSVFAGNVKLPICMISRVFDHFQSELIFV